MGSMKSVLVTGASGYLGAKIALHLKEQGYYVYALCRSLPNNSYNLFAGIEIIQGDITLDSTLELLLTKPIDAIVHTISLDHNLSEIASIKDINKVNVLVTWQLFDKFLKKGLDKFIFLSTIQVIGKLPLQVITEDSIKSPANLYGLTHSFGEDFVNYYNQKTATNCISLRLSNGYGAPVFDQNNCWWLVINDLCRSAYYNKKIVLNSDGTSTRDFIHINDIAKAVRIVLQHENLIDSLLHVSSGQTKSLLEIAHIVKSVYEQKYKAPILVYHSNLILSENPSSSAPSYTISNKKLLAIGFLPELSIEKGVEQIFTYFENLTQHGA
jgi:UDP-glucose 4-epimerase